MQDKDRSNAIFTVPNMLSLFRLLLIPVYVALYLNARSTEDYYLSAGILAVSCLTDMLDGKIARHFNVITTLGKILDPIADKATQITLILCLSTRYPIEIYLIILFVLKESFQIIAGAIAYRKGRILKGALMSGKICTTVLFLSLILLVMLPSLPQSVVYVTFAIDTVCMLAAFADYVTAYLFRDAKFQALPENKK